MILWTILTIIVSMAAIMVAVPLLRGSRDADATEITGLAVYRDQLAEIEKEQQQGVIGKDEAASARLEVERRILALKKNDEQEPSAIDPYWRQKAVIAIAAVVVVGSVGLYTVNGRPELPSAAFIQETNAKTKEVERADNTAQPKTAKPEDSVQNMIRRLEAKLAANPKYADGWRVLGWSYYNIGRYQDAADAYKRAATLKKNSPILKSLAGEALVKAENGRVSDKTLELFKTALAEKPDDVRARYFIGLYKEQNNDPAAAIKDYVALLQTAPAKAEWAKDLRNRVKQLGEKNSIEIAKADIAPKPDTTRPENNAETGKTKAQRAVDAIHGRKGPSAQDIKEADKLAPQDRQAMIRNMVDGLDARLKKSPKNANGWIMLIRSRMVLNEPEAARTALADAMKAFEGDPATQDRVKKAAGSLGLK